MSYWKGLGVAVAIDLIWIMGCPSLATEPLPETQREPVQQVAELTVLCVFDDDLAGQITQDSNRIRGLLT